MNQASREKIALIVFSITIVVFFVAVITYMVLAHSWNIAARSIDEHRGAMEGYTVFVFAGDQVPQKQLEDVSAVDGSLDDVDGVVSTDESDALRNQVAQSDESETTRGVSVDAVKESYQSKGAAVLEIATLNPSSYEGDDIYSVNGRRVGVFYVPEGASLIQLKERVEYFCEHDVDFLLCLTDGSDFVALDSSRIGAVLAIGANASQPTEASSALTFFAVTPEYGTVGAILISPDGVVSSKVHSAEPESAQPEKDAEGDAPSNDI